MPSIQSPDTWRLRLPRWGSGWWWDAGWDAGWDAVVIMSSVTLAENVLEFFYCIDIMIIINSPFFQTHLSIATVAVIASIRKIVQQSLKHIDC